MKFFLVNISHEMRFVKKGSDTDESRRGEQKIMVDRSEVDEAMKKVKQLNRLLKEANTLRNELVKNKVTIKLTVIDGDEFKTEGE